jgi:hypothetical protein
MVADFLPNYSSLGSNSLSLEEDFDGENFGFAVVHGPAFQSSIA